MRRFLLLICGAILWASSGPLSVMAQDKTETTEKSVKDVKGGTEKAPPKKEEKAEKVPVGSANTQDVVFLGVDRPVLIRFEVLMNGKPLQDAWDGFISHLFQQLDLNSDGTLDEREAEGAPRPSELENAQTGLFRFGSSGVGKRMDGDKDGKVTPKEMRAYYRKEMKPFQFQLSTERSNAMAGIEAIYGSSQPEPPVDAIRRESFALIDRNKDGKLSPQELLGAPGLLRLDENEDELVTTQELAPNDIPKLNPFSGRGMMARPKSKSNARKVVMPLPAPGYASPELLEALQKRYGKDRGKEIRLSQKELRLDPELFNKLDANKDQSLNAKELAGFVQRSPDLVLVVRLGKKKSKESRVGIAETENLALRGKAQSAKDKVHLNLGISRLEFRGKKKSSSSFFDAIIRQQVLAQLRQADKNRDGIIDAKEAKDTRRFSEKLFAQMDRDRDEKVTKKEMNDYLAQSSELVRKAQSACVTLSLVDQNRGLFSLFDSNHDKKLSLRELRQGKELLKDFDLEKKGHLTKDNIPQQVQITLTQGQASNDVDPGAAFQAIYGGYGKGYSNDTPTDGPTWFHKMDRNRDGDVSPKEFLFSEEEFRKLDTDGDRLIGLQEAIEGSKK